MMITRKRLLVFSTTPHLDESFLGYLLRLTEINHYDALAWILQLGIIQKNPRQKFALLSIGAPPDLQPLAELTGVDQSSLASLWYQPVDNGGKIPDYAMFGNPVPRYTIRLRQPKICPHCLNESPYIRKIWDLAALTVCPVHKSMLLDECRGCGRRISWSRTAVTVCRCKFDWRKSGGHAVEDSEIEVAQRIYRSSDLMQPNDSDRSSSGTCPLVDLKLNHYLSCLFFITGQFNGVMDTRGKRLATALRNSEIHSLICKANTVFTDWPNNFFSFLDWKRENKPDLRHARGLRRDFGQYKSALYVQLGESCYDFLRAAFEKYIATHWQGGYTTALSRLGNIAPLNKKYLTVVEAKHILKITSESVRKLLAANKLQRANENQAPSGLVLIEAQSVREFRNELIDSFNLHETGKSLRTHARRIFELVESGFLHPLRGPIVDKNHRWQFSRQDVAGFLKRLENSVNTSRSTKGKEITLYDALHKIRKVRGHCGTLIRAVFDGEISVRSKGPVGLSSLLFARDDVVAYSRGELRGQAGNVFSIQEAARFLKTNPMAVYFFVNKGLLKASLLPGFERLGQSTTAEELNTFISKYFVLTRAYAKTLRTHTSYIVARLADENIKPISGRTIDGCPQYVFRRSQIVSTTLEELITSTRVNRSCNGQINTSVNLDQVCNLLKVDRDSAARMIQNGFLRSSVRGRRTPKKDRYFIPYALVEACKRRRIEFTSILSANVAASRLNVNVNTVRNAMKRGELRGMRSEKGLHCFYVFVEDVEKLMRANQLQVGTKEAAAILNVTRGIFNQLVKRRILEPVSGPTVDRFGRKRYLRTDVMRVRAYGSSRWA
jgi:hypothetical protein